MDSLQYGRSVVRQEIEAIEQAAAALGDDFVRAAQMIYDCAGRVIVTGVGKAGIIGEKISATLASTGTPSYWMHAVEARHGDMGRVQPDDVVLALSNSGETEVVELLPTLKKIGAPVVAITGREDSTLARYSDVILHIGELKEACPLGLAPSCTTTAMLVLGDALALTVCQMRIEQDAWTQEDYAFYHPGGELGRRLIKVREVMRTGARNPVAHQDVSVRQALEVMSGESSPGAVSLVDDEHKLVGFFTDGDLRRLMREGEPALLDGPVREVMTRGPKSISAESLASEAYRVLKQYRVDQVPVVDERGEPVGLMDVQDWLDATRGAEPPEKPAPS